MLRSITLALRRHARSACGSTDGSGNEDATAGSAKAIEQTTGLKLAAHPIPAEARDQGLTASFSNAGTAANDHQVVLVFLMKDAGVADKVKRRQGSR